MNEDVDEGIKPHEPSFAAQAPGATAAAFAAGRRVASWTLVNTFKRREKETIPTWLEWISDTPRVTE